MSVRCKVTGERRHVVGMRPSLLLAVLLVSCTAPSTTGEPAVETWAGTRRDGQDGSVARMVLTVRPVLGGAGVLEELEVEGDPPYHGLHVILRDPGTGRWTRHYANAFAGGFRTLEAAEDPAGGVLWRSTSPGRARESRLVEAFPAPGAWLRRQEYSEDGGATWRLRFVDELHLVLDRPEGGGGAATAVPRAPSSARSAR